MSVVIRTPRGVVIKTKNGTSQLRWNKNFAPERTKNFNTAQEYVDSSVLRYCDPLVPMRTGVLKRSGVLGTVIGTGLVRYIAPYAKKQYYENRGTGQRGKMWFERMKGKRKKAILKGAAKFAKARAKS